MIEFGISHYNLEQMVRFSKLLGKSIDEFIIGSIKVHLCEWSYDKDIFINARLIADMRPLTSQIQIGTDMIRLGVGRLANIKAPSYKDNEKHLVIYKEE